MEEGIECPAETTIESHTVPPFRWRYGLILLGASALAGGLMIPFTLDLLRQMKGTHTIPESELPAILAVGFVIETVLSALLIFLGLAAGRSAGMVWPPLDGWDTVDQPESKRRIRNAIGWALVLSVVLSLFVVGLSQLIMLPDGANDLENPPWLSGLLGSTAAGVREELWFRLGLMTIFTWFGAKLSRRREPGSRTVWISNLLTALLFGAMHLPQASGLLGLTPGVVAFVMVGNGIPGLAFGWLYARKGLFAAMLSHFSLDVVLKVILPLVDF